MKCYHCKRTIPRKAKAESLTKLVCPYCGQNAYSPGTQVFNEISKNAGKIIYHLFLH